MNRSVSFKFQSLLNFGRERSRFVDRHRKTGHDAALLGFPADREHFRPSYDLHDMRTDVHFRASEKDAQHDLWLGQWRLIIFFFHMSGQLRYSVLGRTFDVSKRAAVAFYSQVVASNFIDLLAPDNCLILSSRVAAP